MLDDLQNDAPEENLEKTKPRHLPTATPSPDPFESILQTVGTGLNQNRKKILDEGLEELKQDDSLLKPDWLNFETKPTEEDKGELPNWLTASTKDDLIAQKGLPTDRRNTLPDWVKSRKVISDEPDWSAEASEAKKVFDPNETQKTKAVKGDAPELPGSAPVKPKIQFLNLDKYDKAFIVLVAIVLYFAFTLFAGSFIGLRFDEMIASMLGFYLYTIAQEYGWDLRFLLPRAK